MLFRFASILVALAWHGLLSAALAVPLARNHTDRLASRQCEWNADQNRYDCNDQLPTLEQILARMHSTEHGGRVDSSHSAVFYTGLGGMGYEQEQWILAWLEGNSIDYYWLYDAVPFGSDDWWQTQYNFIQDNEMKPEYKEKWDEEGLAIFTNCYYEALAVGALHPEAYVFTPEDHEWDPESRFRETELPYLTHNPYIQKVWRVDPRPRFIGGKGCGTLEDRKLYWEKGVDAPLDVEFSCPGDPPLESMWPAPEEDPTPDPEPEAPPTRS